MSKEALREAGITGELGTRGIRAGDWLEAQLKSQGFPEEIVSAASMQFAMLVLTALRLKSDETPMSLARDLRDRLVEKRRNKIREN